MAISLVGYITAGSSNGGVSVTTGSLDTTGADFLVAVVATGNNGATVADSKSNSWSSVTGRSGNDPAVQIFYSVPGSVGSAHTVTVTVGNAPSVIFLAFKGVKQSSPFDQQNGATSTSSSGLSTGSITPTDNGQLIVVGLATASFTALIAPAPAAFVTTEPVYLLGGQHYTVCAAIQVQLTAAAISGTISMNGTTRVATSIASFKAATTSGGGGATAYAFAG